jgi:hypothetical protein
MVLFLLFAVVAVYTFWDMRQARNMAADACIQAIKGRYLDDYLSAFSKKDYKIMKNDNQVIIVPKRGMGRYRCVVDHDGQVINSSKANFFD